VCWLSLCLDLFVAGNWHTQNGKAAYNKLEGGGRWFSYNARGVTGPAARDVVWNSQGGWQRE
jgi:hypothetical protein